MLYVTVQAISGKLYMHGAGWSDITPPPGPGGQPGIVHFGIAVSVLVDWNETNRRFPLTITIAHEDGDELAKVGAQIEAGRPPGAIHGTEFRSLLAINANLAFPKTGGYVVRAEIDGNERHVSFRVRPPLSVPGTPPLPGQQVA